MEAKTLYLGCRATHNLWKDRPLGILESVDLRGGTITFGEFDNTFPFKNILPLLRPLSSMTQEEMIEWYKVKNEHDGAEGFRHLLSKGFDLFELIESGEAIDSTKL